MLQILILSGKKAGTQFLSSGFPVLVGRSADSDLPLDDPGIWTRHFQIIWRDRDLVLSVEPNALVSVNGANIQEAPLRNGDVISVGATQLQFALSPMTQTSLAPIEWLTWVAIVALCLVQIVVISQLLR